jgi:hypothetical protein
MSDALLPPDSDSDVEQYPLEPRFHPINRVVRIVYDRLASAKLAMFLLAAILLSCLCGGIFFKDESARLVIYGSLWFNGLLILLVINVACCFFGRIWGRRVTIVSLGMILFHLSFVVMFLAIVYNSLFGFQGVLKMTEGETVSNSDSRYYDDVNRGLLFNFSRLTGETSLLKVHRGFKVDGGEKNVAYDIALNMAGRSEKKGTIYINNKFEFNNVEYFRDREGYSVLVILNDKQGKELYGTHIPLQSIKQQNGTYVYSTGTKVGPSAFNFPPEGGSSLFALQFEYLLDPFKDRTGTIKFHIWPVADKAAGHDSSLSADSSGHSKQEMQHNMSNKAANSSAANNMHAQGIVKHDSGSLTTGMSDMMMKKTAEGTAAIDEKFVFGDYQLIPKEVRYWVGIRVMYSPGKPIVLASLCVGLLGLIVTAFGRYLRSKK